tara:strand:+ start:294 stop:602 length:309 start_codon:yes stop_codon:yes gene_type:complete
MAFKLNGWSAFTSPDDKRRLKEARKDLANLRLDRLNPKNIGNKKVQTNLKSAINKIKQDINRFKSNIEADKDFLKEQNEAPVKRSDLDKKGKEIYDKLHKNK